MCRGGHPADPGRRARGAARRTGRRRGGPAATDPGAWRRVHRPRPSPGHRARPGQGRLGCAVPADQRRAPARPGQPGDHVGRARRDRRRRGAGRTRLGDRADGRRRRARARRVAAHSRPSRAGPGRLPRRTGKPSGAARPGPLGRPRGPDVAPGRCPPGARRAHQRGALRRPRGRRGRRRARRGPPTGPARPAPPHPYRLRGIPQAHPRHGRRRRRDHLPGRPRYRRAARRHPRPRRRSGPGPGRGPRHRRRVPPRAGGARCPGEPSRRRTARPLRGGPGPARDRPHRRGTHPPGRRTRADRPARPAVLLPDRGRRGRPDPGDGRALRGPRLRSGQPGQPPARRLRSSGTPAPGARDDPSTRPRVRLPDPAGAAPA